MASMMPKTRNSLALAFTLLFLLQSKALLIASQSQNIETFYPSTTASQSVPPPRYQSPPLLRLSPPPPSPSKTIVKAVVATAAGSAALAGIFYFLLQRCVVARREKKVQGVSQLRRLSSMRRSDFVRFDGVLKGLIVDEDGLDVLYWRKLTNQEGKSLPSNSRAINGRNPSFRKVLDSLRNSLARNTSQKPEEATCSSSRSRKYGEVDQEVAKQMKQEVGLLPGNDSLSSSMDRGGNSAPSPPSPPVQPVVTSSAIESQVGTQPLPLPPALRGKNQKEPPVAPPPPPPPPKAKPPPPPPPPPKAKPTPPPPFEASGLAKTLPPPPQPVATSSALKTHAGSPPLPLPPALRGKNHEEPPVPPPPPRKATKIRAKTPPPPPFEASGLAKPPPPPPLPPGKAANCRKGKLGESSASGGPLLKPLHWEKLEVNGDNSMVWDKIGDGSFRVDYDLMEALFGSVATNQKTLQDTGKTSTASNLKPDTSSKIFILDARKSQNIAIVVKLLGASRRDILEALSEGQGLTVDTLEKLDRITLTKKEESEIIQFDGDPSRLADAESFLYYLLRAFPSAFTRIRAMLFKLNFDSEMTNLSESLQILKLACEELRARGIFVKLLEAILKAGNRMNAGTTRGNASAFDLNSLRKLSDVKSTDGKTTLLHFVVEEVICSEGKRCVLNRNRRLSRTFSQSSSDTSLSSDSTPAKPKEERAKEYIMLGLPVVGCLSVEFSNVKKAAGVDYPAFSALASGLKNRLSEIRELMLKCDNDQTGFQKEMKEFLEMAEEEMDSLRKEQAKVMELVKKTTEYYQTGGSRDHGTDPLQIFVIVKDFLGMVDQVCLEIARKLQRSKRAGAKLDSSSEKSPAMRLPMKFPNMPLHSILQKSSGSGSSDSSDSDTDF